MNICFNNQKIAENRQVEIWKAAHYSEIKPSIFPIGHSKWGKLLCIWSEKKEDATIQHHFYSAVINTKTLDIYMDCRPRKIFAKCMALLFTRPIHIFFKTIYHLSIFPIFHEASKVLVGDQTLREGLKNSVKSLADIVRTPLYGLAMTITTLGGIILGVVFPNTLYYTREILGKLEESLFWGQKRTAFTLAQCFQPYSLMTLTNLYQHQRYEDTLYLTNDPVRVALTHFARWDIQHRRKKYNCFNQLSGKLNPSIPYTSPSLQKLLILPQGKKALQ